MYDTAGMEGIPSRSNLLNKLFSWVVIRSPWKHLYQHSGYVVSLSVYVECVCGVLVETVATRHCHVTKVIQIQFFNDFLVSIWIFIASSSGSNSSASATVSIALSSKSKSNYFTSDTFRLISAWKNSSGSFIMVILFSVLVNFSIANAFKMPSTLISRMWMASWTR